MDIKTCKIKLSNGLLLPTIGLVIASNDIESIEEQIKSAIVNNGYLHLHISPLHENEIEIGIVLNLIFKNGSINRNNLFITGEISPSSFSTESTIFNAFKKTLLNLQLDYLDSYLIQSPGINSKLYIQTWKVMETLYNEKKVKSIGVSNFTINQLKELIKNSNIVPMILHLEYHPYLDYHDHDHDLFKFCNDNNIILEGFSLFNGGKVLIDPIVIEISKLLNKTPSQVLLRWAIQKGIAFIIKSTRSISIKENSQIFDFTISNNHMLILNSLNKNKRFQLDPTKCI